jgi:ATP-binding cassette subfamily B protein
VVHGFLYEFSNFGRLPATAMQALIEKLDPKAAAKGELVLREGDLAGPMYIIQEGRVRIFTTHDGQTRNRAFLREGDFFGELSILTNAPRAASVQALTDCRLLAIAPETVRELNQRFPEFARLMEERKAQYQGDKEAHLPLDFSTEVLPAEAQTTNKVELASDTVAAD